MNKTKLNKIIQEEIARNLQSTGEAGMTWKDIPGIKPFVHADPSNNRYFAYVKCEADPQLSTPQKFFNSQTDAEFWLQKTVENIRNKLINK